MAAIAVVLAFLVACALCATSASAATYTNPVLDKQVPDPGVFYDPKSKLYLMSTTGGSPKGKFPLATSKDLINWQTVGAIFPTGSSGFPQWSDGSFWAPEIFYWKGKYVCVFTGETTDGTLSVGIAFAKSALGPYQDLGRPLLSKKGYTNIDPHIYRDPKTGVIYLLWKTRGGGGTRIWIRPMNGALNGFKTGTKPKLLIRNDLPWEGVTVEGPFVVYRKPYYYLWYSGNSCCVSDAKYAVGVARSKSIKGPYVKKKSPILKASSRFIGPGHGSIVKLASNPKKFVFVYHTWLAGHVAGSGDKRVLMVDTVRWNSKRWPYFPNNVPSHTAQPVPV